MIDHPDLVTAVHRDYIDAGATVMSTNTYAVHVSRLERVGLEDRLGELQDIALSAAEQARADRSGIRIAGCMGPLLATYRPDLDADEDLAERRFGDIALALAPRVDLLLLETVSSCQEARGALRGVAKAARPVWIAFTVDDDDGTRLRSGEPLADALPVIDGKVAAVLLNCSRPEAISQGLSIIARSGVPFGAYANGFTNISAGFKEEFPTVDTLEARTDLSPAAYAEFVLSWVDAGATIVGGCCETGPAHIAEIARRLAAADHHIT